MGDPRNFKRPLELETLFVRFRVVSWIGLVFRCSAQGIVTRLVLLNEPLPETPGP